MKTKSLFISAQEVNAGMLFVTMGMMEILKRNIHRVAFFRPIIFKDDVLDEDVDFMLRHYNLDMKYEDACGFDVDYVENMIASNKTNELINQLIFKFKKLEKNYDFVLCEGIRLSFLSSNITFDVNIKIAQNFGSSYVNVINAKEESAKTVHESVLIEHKAIVSQGCEHFATFVNRLDDEKYALLRTKLQNDKHTIYLLREVEELSLLSIEDVIESLGAVPVVSSDIDNARTIRGVRVAALGLDNFLGRIEENDLIIVPADRSEIILGLLGALYSKAYPNISAIVFPFSMQAHPNIQKLLMGLEKFNVPILSVPYDTYETARRLFKIHARIRINSVRKIALSLGLFNASVDTAYIEKKIATSQNNVMTPMMFEYKLFDLASSKKKRIVLPESGDARVLRAAEIILRREVAEIILIGDPEEVREHYMRLGLNLSKATIVDHIASPQAEEFALAFYEMRKHKGLGLDAARDSMDHPMPDGVESRKIYV